MESERGPSEGRGVRWAWSGAPRWLRWTGMGAIGVVTLVAAVWGTGALLPEHHTASVSRTLPAPPERVWTAMTEVEDFPTWRAEVDEVRRLPDRNALPVWRESGRYGAMTLEVTELDPPRRLVTRIADEELPFGGSWTYELDPTGEETRLTITEDGTVSDPFFRFMARFVFGHTATMETYLAGLERLLEPAEPDPTGAET